MKETSDCKLNLNHIIYLDKIIGGSSLSLINFLGSAKQILGVAVFRINVL